MSAKTFESERAEVSQFVHENREALRRELGRLFAVTAEALQRGMQAKEIQMPGGALDEFWHEFLGDAGYDDFCMQTAGARIVHVASDDPTGAGRGFGLINWTPIYEEKFGPLDDMWFRDEHGNRDEEALGAYKRTGELRMSWNCNPKVHEQEVAHVTV